MFFGGLLSRARVGRRHVLFFSSKTSSARLRKNICIGGFAGSVAAAMLFAATSNEAESESSSLGDKYSIYEKCELKLFPGNAHPQLASNMAACLDIPFNKATVSKFKNGESRVEILNSVRDCDVYVVQPTCNPCPNDYIMELVILLDAFRRAGAVRSPFRTLLRRNPNKTRDAGSSYSNHSDLWLCQTRSQGQIASSDFC